jgi:hypothetical protein
MATHCPPCRCSWTSIDGRRHAFVGGKSTVADRDRDRDALHVMQLAGDGGLPAFVTADVVIGRRVGYDGSMPLRSHAARGGAADAARDGVRELRLPIALRAVLACAITGYAWWAMTLLPYTWPSQLTVLLPGALLLTVGAVGKARRNERLVDVGANRARGPGVQAMARTPAPERPSWLVAALVAWTVVIAASIGFELLNYFLAPRTSHPTMSSMMDQVDDWHVGRVVVFVLWFLLGWDLVRR